MTTPHCKSESAFTLTEMLIVIATIVAVAGLVAPSLARTGVGSRAIGCLANKHRLMGAWTMFAMDNDGLWPGVGTVSSPPGTAWTSGYVDWSTSSDNTNTLRLTLRTNSVISSYLHGDTEAFRCPADTYISVTQARAGWTERIRSVSGSGMIGGYSAGTFNPDTAYYIPVTNMSQVLNPGPANMWSIVDEHPDSLNDASILPPANQSWLDLPASYHDRGAGFVMADGHAEIHHWENPRMAAPVTTTGIFSSVPVTSNDPDYLWVRQRQPHR